VLGGAVEVSEIDVIPQTIAYKQPQDFKLGTAAPFSLLRLIPPALLKNET
jgi:hypothetical protein